ncbi:prenylated flavin chaperone LpdD [Gorillibacterium timonense]|uniref:prenylated flavin chaperone LpdD n=1 Tax=Gorillibacterium timonense TaxID=1689269 RepID=UPI00071DC43D|nr:hypothetical protein [Gorillibacterium timonense]
MNKAAKPPFDIRIHTERMGKDYLFLITGGEAHIGATAMAFYQDGKIHTELAVVPGHREDRLALECAGMACTRLSATVTVVMGIHIEAASRSDIELAVQTVREEMNRVLDELLPVVHSQS